MAALWRFSPRHSFRKQPARSPRIGHSIYSVGNPHAPNHARSGEHSHFSSAGHSSELGLKPLSVAVLDAGGHLQALQRQDGASILRPQIAIAKASGALALGVSSRKIGEIGPVSLFAPKWPAFALLREQRFVPWLSGCHINLLNVGCSHPPEYSSA